MNKETQRLGKAIRAFLRTILEIRKGTDKKATVEGIERDINFRGPTAWILIFSILIASIGLNVNSAAVIIGAMLISPLMGPILGLGLSIGISDLDMLVRSLKNLGVAVGIALITSTFYFWITPLNLEQSELLARTQPTILDVLVALFGGFAGIIAGSRKEKSNVVPGVAIATALMPPLCTAGYGLATLNLEYFLGAMYLFLINTVFLSLSTFLVVRYLKFPLKTYIERKRLIRYRWFLWSFVVIIILPSTLIFYKVIQETRFTISAENFIANEVKFDGTEIINHKIRYSDTVSTIDLYLIGNNITSTQQQVLYNKLKDYGLTADKKFPLTDKTNIRFYQEGSTVNLEEEMSKFNNNFRLKILEDIYSKNEDALKDKEARISFLENELLSKDILSRVPLEQIKKELRFQFKGVDRFSFGERYEYQSLTDSATMDTIPTFFVSYSSNYPRSSRSKTTAEIETWLQIRLNNNRIKSMEY